MVRFRILVFLTIWFAGAGIGTGICEETKLLSLQGAVRIAVEHNPEVRAFGNALSAQQEDIGVARSFLLPKLALEENAARTNNPPNIFMMKLNQERFAQSDFAVDKLNKPAPINDFQTLVSLEQPLFARKAQIGLTMAKQEYAAKKEDFLRKKEEIALRVSQAYLKILTTRECVSVARKALEDAREHARIAELRHNADLGLYSDALRARTSVTEAEQRLVKVETDLAVAKRWLALLLGMDDSVDVASENLIVPLKEIDYYLSVSPARRDITALKLRRENAQNNVKLAESRYFPTLGLRGTYQLNDHNNAFGSEGNSWLVMASLRWDLFDGANREFERRKALHKAAETEEYLKGLKQLASFKIHEAYLTVEEVRKSLELSKSALESAEEGRRLVRIRYENSLSPIVDLLDVQLTLDHARANAVARQNDYFLAIINLGYESGTIMKDLQVE